MAHFTNARAEKTVHNRLRSKLQIDPKAIKSSCLQNPHYSVSQEKEKIIGV